MCKRTHIRNIPLAEVWKRRFVLSSICLVILSLVGLVMMAVELTKLQRNVYNVVTTVGFSISIGGTFPLYLIFGYTVLRHDQYPTGPVLIWGNALYMLIGIALVCVAFVVPADSMFHMISFGTMDDDPGGFSGLGPANNTTALQFHSVFEKDVAIRANDREMQAVWNKELIYIIQVRVALLGGAILMLGLCGGATTLIIIYRTYRFIKYRRAADMIRRKNIRTLMLKPKNQTAMRRLRDSVYDYAGWENRTSDIYHEPENEGRRSTTPSLLSTKLTSASLASAVEDGHRRAIRNHDAHAMKVGEILEEPHPNGDFYRRTSLMIKSDDAIAASFYEMKALNPDVKSHSTTG